MTRAAYHISKASDGDGTSKDTSKDKVFRLTDIDVKYVSLVDAGANRQRKFQIVKSEDIVPSEVSTDEERVAAEAARVERAQKYGIEMLETGAMIYPKGGPMSTQLYGDPVNFLYPLGKEDGTFDKEMILAAIEDSRLNKGQHQSDASRALIHERIVAVALAHEIEITVDSENETDALLSEETLSKIKEKGEKNTSLSGDDSAPIPEGDDLSGWLNKASATVDSLQIDFTISQALDSQSPSSSEGGQSPIDKADVGNGITPSPQVEAIEKIETLEREIEGIKKENATLKAQVKKLSEKCRTMSARHSTLKAAMIGGTSTLPTGEVLTTKSRREPEPETPSNIAWRSGGDMAAAVERETK